MSRKKPRDLHPEEAALWERVADSARALHPKRKAGVKVPKPTPPLPVSTAPEIQPFRIGETASRRSTAQAPPQVFTPRPSGGPVQMDHKAFTKMMRGKLRPEAKIDLHGLTLARAHPALLAFVLGAHARGRRLILVVTGKGRDRTDDGNPIAAPRGALKQQVPAWLSQPPLAQAILQVTEAHQSHGGGGAFYVYLRRQPGLTR